MRFDIFYLNKTRMRIKELPLFFKDLLWKWKEITLMPFELGSSVLILSSPHCCETP